MSCIWHFRFSAADLTHPTSSPVREVERHREGDGARSRRHVFFWKTHSQHTPTSGCLHWHVCGCFHDNWSKDGLLVSQIQRAKWCQLPDVSWRMSSRRRKCERTAVPRHYRCLNLWDESKSASVLKHHLPCLQFPLLTGKSLQWLKAFCWVKTHLSCSHNEGAATAATSTLKGVMFQ